jgi:peptidoglycan/LPS O-acetylase OafA/YrhL
LFGHSFPPSEYVVTPYAASGCCVSWIDEYESVCEWAELDRGLYSRYEDSILTSIILPTKPKYPPPPNFVVLVLTLFIFIVLDAWGKLPAGIMNGNLYSVGVYDECKKLGLETARYCSIINGDPARTAIQLSLDIPQIVENKDLGAVPFFLIWFGTCVPPSCDETNLINSLNNETENSIFQARLDTSKALANLTVSCDHGKVLGQDGSSVAMLIITIIIAVVGVTATVLDEFWTWQKTPRSQSVASPRGYEPIKNIDDANPAVAGKALDIKDEEAPPVGHGEGGPKRYTPRGGIHQICRLISPLENMRSVMQVKEEKIVDHEPDLRSLNGIRVLSIMWVILGHMYFWILTLPYENGGDLFAKFTEFDFLIVLNAFFSVDSFFVLSGFLTAYMMMKEFDKEKPFTIVQSIGAFIHRYLRITPSYAFILFFTATLGDYIGNGPFWRQLASPGHDACRTKWWRNILYIDDFWTTTENCVGYGWYLSNDMQFFVLSVLILPLYRKYHKLTHVLFGLIMLGSFISCIVLTYKHDLKGFWVSDILLLLEGKGGNFDRIYGIIKYIYFKPWARVQPYIVGVYAGMIQHNWGRQMWRKWMPVWKSNLLVALALAVLGACLFGLSTEQRGFPLSQAENAIYIAFSRTGWAIGLSVILLACINGRGGYINGLLSLPVWTPFARVGLFTYLVHPLVLDYFYYALKEPLYYNDTRYAFYFFGVVGMTYAFAFALSAFIESPLRNLEKVKLKGKSEKA